MDSILRDLNEKSLSKTMSPKLFLLSSCSGVIICHTMFIHILYDTKKCGIMNIQDQNVLQRYTPFSDASMFQ